LLAGGAAASLIAVAIFGAISEDLLEGEAIALDTEGVALARRTRSPAADRVLGAATATGEPWAIVGSSGLMALRWLRAGRHADAGALVLSVAGAAAANQVLKRIFHRERPALKLRRAHASGYSFPSGHSMMTLSTYGSIVYLVARHNTRSHVSGAQLPALPVAVLCAAVGWSRVYLEVHYPTDVIGGWAAGTIWLVTTATARNLFKQD
jgi:undecaprenyl-diphosphatase